MEVAQAMKLIYAHRAIENCRLTSGETVDPCHEGPPFQSEPIILAEVLLKSVARPTQQEFALRRDEDSLCYVKDLMSDIVYPL
jgi:hypothetical protein